MKSPLTVWAGLLAPARQVFRAPSFAIFTGLITGWVLAPGRRTVTAMITAADPAAGRAHDAYHRLLRDGAWSMTGLWRLLATHAVDTFAPTGVIALDCDDTLFHKSGRQVEGAGNFRDAVRSTSKRVVFALGLNLVVVTLRFPRRGARCRSRSRSMPGCTRRTTRSRPSSTPPR